MEALATGLPAILIQCVIGTLGFLALNALKDLKLSNRLLETKVDRVSEQIGKQTGDVMVLQAKVAALEREFDKLRRE